MLRRSLPTCLPTYLLTVYNLAMSRPSLRAYWLSLSVSSLPPTSYFLLPTSLLAQLICLVFTSYFLLPTSYLLTGSAYLSRLTYLLTGSAYLSRLYLLTLQLGCGTKAKATVEELTRAVDAARGVRTAWRTHGRAHMGWQLDACMHVMHTHMHAYILI